MLQCNTTDCPACVVRLTDFVLVVNVKWQVLEPKEPQHPEHHGTPGTQRNTRNTPEHPGIPKIIKTNKKLIIKNTVKKALSLDMLRILSHYLNSRWQFTCKPVAFPQSLNVFEVMNLLFECEVALKVFFYRCSWF